MRENIRVLNDNAAVTQGKLDRMEELVQYLLNHV